MMLRNVSFTTDLSRPHTKMKGYVNDFVSSCHVSVFGKKNVCVNNLITQLLVNILY